MEQTFDSILSSILNSIEENPNKDLNQLLADKLTEMGVSSESKQLLDETNSMLDIIEDKKNSLRVAKSTGSTRNVWMQQQIFSITSNKSLSEEDQNAIVSEVEKKYNESLKDAIEKGE